MFIHTCNTARRHSCKATHLRGFTTTGLRCVVDASLAVCATWVVVACVPGYGPEPRIPRAFEGG